MPGLQGEHVVAALGSPVRRNKLSLKFLQKKDTKRALDFSESQTDEPSMVEPLEPEARSVFLGHHRWLFAAGIHSQCCVSAVDMSASAISVEMRLW